LTRTHHYYAQRGRFGEITWKKEDRKLALTLHEAQSARKTASAPSRHNAALAAAMPVEAFGRGGVLLDLEKTIKKATQNLNSMSTRHGVRATCDRQPTSRGRPDACTSSYL